MASEKMRERGIHVQFGIDGTAAGVLLSLGPDIKILSGSKQKVSFDGGSDFVFALRLRVRVY